MNIYELDLFESSDEYVGNKPLCDAMGDRIYLPNTHCFTCGLDAGRSGYPIPEADSLPSNHPLLKEIKKILKRIWRARNEITDIVMFEERFDKDDPIWQRYDTEGSITPAEYHELVERLRTALGLPSGRLIFPFSRLGSLEILCRSNRIPDFMEISIGYGTVVHERVRDILLKNQITGWKCFPVKVRHPKRLADQALPPLVELVVTGNAGIPANFQEGRDYSYCHECGFTKLLNVPPLIPSPPPPPLGPGAGSAPVDMPESPDPFKTATLDAAQWDGSDMFQFSCFGGVYVTERCKEVLEREALTGVSFR